VSIGRAIPANTCRIAVLTLVATVLATALPAGGASAQGLLDVLFGRRAAPPPPPAHAYVDPYPQFPGARPGSPPAASERSGPVLSGGRSVYYCVRLCDGRHFPIQRHANATPAQLCNAFCPASRTKIYSGSSIDRAVSADGMRYADLNTAYAYRDKLVDGCTCNGKDPLGLARVDFNDDPTLRPGDIVATSQGMMAYSGTGGRHRTAEFTPVEHYRGLSADLRNKLSELKIEPAAAVPMTQPGSPPADDPIAAQLRAVQSAR
jgi:hypothetical protein